MTSPVHSPKLERKKQKEKSDSNKEVRTDAERKDIEKKGAEELKKTAQQQAQQNAEEYQHLLERGKELFDNIQNEKLQFESALEKSSKTLNKKLKATKIDLEARFAELESKMKEVENLQSDSFEDLKNELQTVENDLKTTKGVENVLVKIEKKLKNKNVSPKFYKRVFLSIPGWMLISAVLGAVSATGLGIAAIVVADKKDEENINNIIIQRDSLEDQEPKTEQEKEERNEKIKALNEKIKAKQGASIINQNDEEVWSNMSEYIKEEEEPPFEQVQALQTLQYLAKPSTVIWKDEAKDKFDLAKSLIHHYNESEEMIWPDIYEYGYKNLKYNEEKIPRKDLAEIYQLATTLYILQIQEMMPEETKVEAFASA